MHEHNEILVALVGQPNSGKSTVFNFLTGLHQTIANYPGVTVTKKSGHYHDGKRRIEVVDLPGTYSLTSYSQEERVTRDFLLVERPEVVVAIVDASNIRRHFYFLFQLLELRTPLVVCLNMMDLADRRGMKVDIGKLERELGCPVIATSGRQGTGLEELRAKINEVSALHAHDASSWKIDYGRLEPIIENIVQKLSAKDTLVKQFCPRWLAVKLLENDREARRIVQHHIQEKDWESLLGPCLKEITEYEKSSGESPRKTIAAKRNERAERLEKDVVDRPAIVKRSTDTLDRLLCHPILGLFAVALVMFLSFQLAFKISDGWDWFPWPDEKGQIGLTTPVEACDSIFSHWTPLLLDKLFNLPEGDLRSLIYDGIVAGIGGVLVFVPVIFFIFLFISALEQSGYMARVVVVLDRIMRVFGLHGQSVLPMILGGGIVGGCAVPAVMATRTMREPRERILTILVIPIMNCGAKIPVYALLIAAFFSAWQGAMLVAIIFLSWSIALASAWVLGRTFVKGDPTPLVIELPTYQRPGLIDVCRTAMLQSWYFIKKAGTIILAVNVLLWVLMYYPKPEDPDATASERLQGSYAAQMGRFFEPVSHLAGFDWRDNVALIGGFAAKEVVVSALATVYNIEADDEEDEEIDGPVPVAPHVPKDDKEHPQQEKVGHDEPLVAKTDVPSDLTPSLTDDIAAIDSEDLDSQGKRLALQLRKEPNWSPLKAFALLIFVMVYAPCAATCAVIWQETGTPKYMLIAMIYTTALAAILAIAIYQIGSLLMAV